MNNWPADRVNRRPIADLVPYARNARMHSDEQIDQLAASITEWGWTVPVLVDKSGTLIAGHGRILAAQKLGIAEVPAMVAEGWSDAKKRAYIIADNKLTLNAEWDEEILSAELKELRDLDFDLPLIGFDSQELNDLIGSPNLGPTPEAGSLDAADAWSMCVRQRAVAHTARWLRARAKR